MTDLLGVVDRARSVPRQVSQTVIERHRLNHLYASSTGRVIRVLAPGGFGKSSLVARWTADESRRVVWVDIEPIDNDPGVLAAALHGALNELNPAGFASIPVAAAGSPSFRDWVVPALGAAVRGCAEPFVLVLDDVHEIDNPDSDALFCAIAENLPERSTLLLAGRAHRIDRSIARLRLNPGVIDVTASDLALDAAESRTLLVAMGLDRDADLDDVIARFEGWPAGLRLAGQVLLTNHDLTGLSAIDVSDATHITDYLSAEWTSSIDPDDVPLLREAACLERFTADMCDEVLGRSGSRGVLRRLEREDQLVLPLDVRGDWFRMHQLLAGWLEAELRDAQRARWREVHRAACDWWEARGDIDRALAHAARIGDIDRCESLVIEHAAIRFPMGAHDTVRRWLGMLPEERIRASPGLCALAAVSASHRGDGRAALQWTRHLAGVVGLDGSGSIPHAVDDRERWATALALTATLENRSTVSQIAAAESARDALPVGLWRTMAIWALGGHLFMIGDDRATEVWADGAMTAEFLGAPNLAANCLASEAIVHELSGDRDRAMELGLRAQKLVRSVGGTLLPPSAITVAVSSLVEARRRPDVASTEFAIARRHLESHQDVAPWFNVMARLALVRTALLIDDRPAARTLLREAEHCAARPGDASGVEPHLAALWAQVDAVSATTADGSSALTPSERKVLAYLPTNLSLSEIATELFVSRNTVKSHATAIYRKLGATSRSETVALGRRAGLIDHVSPDR
ncbi:LuxR C-terminal-related transcriptional regulator [Ilumatobacter sp.]|uniref:LuxR C-terminal-related transcriptional regulator n=1 Tax=Ilumatobacter sp. TaxID=1967498 RepID=UPI003C5F2ED5